ncbi:MAG: type II secretion system F family protein [Candidatus Pacebacteria bacterium]|nr:type II secretion system F family protein [Candidatus Paceibacterota bacterium]
MQFSYRVKSPEGKLIDGVIDAADEREAIAELQARGLVITSLQPAGKSIFSVDINAILNAPKTKDVVVFTRQLSTLVEADMPLAESMRTLALQSENVVFSRVISEIANDLEGGMQVSAAFAEHPKLFSQFFVKLVRSGEASGRLQQSLTYLAEYLERSQAITSRVRNAMAYPVFVIVAMLAVGLIMMLYVLPQLLVIFKDAGTISLPVTTRALIWLTDFVNQYVLVILMYCTVAVVGVWQWIKTTEGHLWFDKMKIRVPGIGVILKSVYLARIAENLSTLIRSDIAILDALRITADIVDHDEYRDILLHAEEEVRGGGTISSVLRQYRSQVPAMMSSMIAIGERTGKIDTMLGHVSQFYRTESENRLDSITSLIEPVLVVVLGIGVALLVSSVLLPMYSLSGVG